MRGAILLIATTLLGAVSTWNIPKDTWHSTRDHNAQQTLQDPLKPIVNGQLRESSEDSIVGVADTGGDISIFEKWPSPQEPEFYHTASIDIPSSDADENYHINKSSDPALAGHHIATEPALLDPHQDPIMKQKRENDRKFSVGTEEEEDRQEEKWKMEEEVKGREPRAHRRKIQLFAYPRDIPEEGYGVEERRRGSSPLLTGGKCGRKKKNCGTRLVGA
ncbi:hypothetical protein BDZ45DRAFT_308279 [Acephala macrosclerotiorum]|nr:hypothetical protein BDZ45DRAFT_308279 [Acephala macrosclerotiorum]